MVQAHIVYGPEQESGFFSTWSFPPFFDSNPRELLYPPEDSDRQRQYVRDSWDWTGRGATVHWFTESRYVVFWFDVYSLDWNDEFSVFEFWSVGDDGIHRLDSYHLESYDNYQYSDRSSLGGTHFVETSVPDLFFMGVYSFQMGSTHDDWIRSMGYMEGFWIGADGTVELSGSDDFMHPNLVQEIIDTFHGNAYRIEISATWLQNTEYNDVIVGATSGYYSSDVATTSERREDETTRRFIHTLVLDPINKTFEFKDAIWVGMFVPGTPWVAYRSSADSYCFAANNGRAALISLWGDQMVDPLHYVDSCTYSSTGVLSDFQRTESDHLWVEQRTERPDCWVYTFAAWGYGIPHAWGDLHKVLPDGRILMGVHNWIEYYVDAGWVSPTEWDNNLGNVVPANPKFGATSPDQSDYASASSFGWYIVDPSTNDIQWGGWDSERGSKLVPGTSGSESSETSDMIARIIDDKIIWLSIGDTWPSSTPITFGYIDILDIHLSGNYIGDGQDQVIWWPGFSPDRKPKPGNTLGINHNWTDMLSLSPSGEHGFLVAQGRDIDSKYYDIIFGLGLFKDNSLQILSEFTTDVYGFGLISVRFRQPLADTGDPPPPT